MAGTFIETAAGRTFSVTFTVDSNGVITSCTGFASPVSGRIYGVAGHTAGMIRTGEPDQYDQIQVKTGTLSGDSYGGKYDNDSGYTPSGIGSFSLTRAAVSTNFALPDTGQTKCYDASGTVINCSGTGQDGEYSINPMSFTDNGNGTVTDNVTGMMWQKCSMGQSNYADCTGGLSNWR